MDANSVKSDFENIFLANEGESFTILREGNVISTELGIVNGKLIQMRVASPVLSGDILRSDVSCKSFKVVKITFETIGSIRTCMEVHCSGL